MFYVCFTLKQVKNRSKRGSEEEPDISITRIDLACGI